MSERTTYPDTGPERFIEVWQTSDSVQEVSDRLKMPKPIVLARASNYRAAGVNLKDMKRAAKKALDVAGLNKLIADLAAKGNPKVEQSPPQASDAFPDGAAKPQEPKKRGRPKKPPE